MLVHSFWQPAKTQSWEKKAVNFRLNFACDKIHVVNHVGEPRHYYSRIRSFKIPTIPSPITTSLHNKTSLNIIFTQFCILLSHQNKIYSFNTTTDFYVASAKLSPLQCGTNIFAGVNLRMAIFLCVFFGTNFCDWGNCLFFLGINFCHFPEAAFYLEL